MNKIFVVAAALIFLFSSIASAANQNNTGCGLGTIIFEDASFADTTLGQAFIVTTNGTSGNQTFGISSGTSNCEQPGSFAKNERLHEFVVANMDNLAADIATGRGESLDTMAELMEIPASERTLIFARLQSNFDNIYTSESIQAGEFVDNVSTFIR